MTTGYWKGKQYTLFTLNIGTPQLLTILVLRFVKPLDVFKILQDEWQTVYTLIICGIFAASDLGLHCSILSVPKVRVIMVEYVFKFLNRNASAKIIDPDQTGLHCLHFVSTCTFMHIT